MDQDSFCTHTNLTTIPNGVLNGKVYCRVKVSRSQDHQRIFPTEFEGAAYESVGRFAGQALTCWDLARDYGVRDVDGAQPHWGEHLDEAVEAVLAKEQPTEDERMLLQFRGPQIDFDRSRADQRARIAAYLARHPAPGPLS